MSSATRNKTYVLVHGAYHGAWCWKEVTQTLRGKGHTVYTPTLTGLGERSHLLTAQTTLDTFIEDIAQVIKFEDLSEVILVGHSFAGSVLSAIADRMPDRLRHLVYLDALILNSGESSADRSPERVEAYRQKAIASGDGLSIPPAEPIHYGITDSEQAKWYETKLTPHPLQTYYDKLHLKNTLGNGVPTTYIACSNPYFATTEASRTIAQSMPGWEYLEIPTGHNAMSLMPEQLTQMLLAIT
ncbi:alpha/beta fold hydrolase [Advenella mimigardefordensis]|uniref:Putative esterase n=1 Tax=Advenella mimigardefordensis (strain DSM 17166 / LMG 22922 / DPN7) TaxID=1247726 RepID=W0PFS0_ADVMD|nr:alpha/beta fold hydrolase [Advenella mimigardefordensis]AHG64135.1 putative esterase [Advenella mimigardefordensis DPN7]